MSVSSNIDRSGIKVSNANASSRSITPDSNDFRSEKAMFSSMGFTSLSPTSTNPIQLTDTFSSLQMRGSISNSDLPATEFSKKLFNTDSTDCGIADTLPPATVAGAGAVVATTSQSKNVPWNPFEDPTPFNQMTEDNIIEAEFDAIRDRNGRSCNCN